MNTSMATQGPDTRAEGEGVAGGAVAAVEAEGGVQTPK